MGKQGSPRAIIIHKVSPYNLVHESHAYYSQANVEIEASGPYCPLCKADPTIPREATEKRNRLSGLDEHLKGNEHTCHEQLRRVLEIDRKHSLSGEIRYHLCQLTFREDDELLKHVEQAHADELWPVEDDAWE